MLHSVSLHSRNLVLSNWLVVHFFFLNFNVKLQRSLSRSHPHISAACMAHSNTKVSACPTNTSRTSLSHGKRSFQNKQLIEIKSAFILLLLSSSVAFKIPFGASYHLLSVWGRVWRERCTKEELGWFASVGNSCLQEQFLQCGLAPHTWRSKWQQTSATWTGGSRPQTGTLGWSGCGKEEEKLNSSCTSARW